MDNNNIEKKTETTLNIILDLGYRHTEGDKQQETQYQITRAAFITRSLFRMIELAATGSEMTDDVNQFVCDLSDIAILGDALQRGIVECIERLGMNQRQQSEDILNTNLLND